MKKYIHSLGLFSEIIKGGRFTCTSRSLIFLNVPEICLPLLVLTSYEISSFFLGCISVSYLVEFRTV